MQSKLQLILSPEQAAKSDLLKKHISEKLEISPERVTCVRILKKSIDARSGRPKINLSAEVFWDEEPVETKIEFDFKHVENCPSVIIIGAGPAGLFAALKLIEEGYKPIVLERGKNARERKKDIALLNRNQEFNSESNYCFGEGGAGTFSDGKLHTRSKKKGDIQRIYELFHYHGASNNILYETHPHIGSDKLPLVIESITKTIREFGGEVHFEQRVTELVIENDHIKGCKTASGNEFKSDALILAAGHSAHDVYEMLHRQNVALELKGFAMGVRVEHPQALIDSIQYHTKQRSEYLPAATYSLVEQIDGRGVYSFCMCPGGHMVPAGSEKEGIVVNGMSVSKRNSPYANSGIVVEIRPEDIPEDFKQYGSLAGLKYQQYVENLAFRNNGGLGETAPAQRLHDFVNGKLSADLPECSYLPGVISSPLHFWLPDFIAKRLQKGFVQFNKRMRGFLTNEAIIVGVESRSSSAVRIPRDRETGQHPDIIGLFPSGEGSGYSGGITSSAIDGENMAQKAAEYLKNRQ